MRPLKNKEMEGRGILHIKRGEGKGVAVRSESSCKSPPCGATCTSSSRGGMPYPTDEDIIIPGVLYKLKAMLSRMF